MANIDIDKLLVSTQNENATLRKVLVELATVINSKEDKEQTL